MSDFQALIAGRAANIDASAPVSSVIIPSDARPWAGIGGEIGDADSVDAWAAKTGLDWTAERAVIEYNTPGFGRLKASGRDVIYHSKTGDDLGLVSSKFEIVQPRQTLEFLKGLEAYGHKIKRAGKFKKGAVVWAQASTGRVGRVGSNDGIEQYLLFATSFDGSHATTVKETNLAIWCYNSFVAALRGKGSQYRISHRSEWNDRAAREALKLGEFNRTEELVNRLVEKRIEPQQAVPFLLSVYHGLTTQQAADANSAADQGDAKAKTVVNAVEKTLTRFSDILAKGHGQSAVERKDTAWGLFSAVTYDVDHTKPARSQENRLYSAWFGEGENTKGDAWGEALKLAGVQQERVLVPVAR